MCTHKNVWILHLHPFSTSIVSWCMNSKLINNKIKRKYGNLVQFWHDVWDSRCSISSTPGSDSFLVRASNSNTGSISRSGSHKYWISHTRWDGNLLNLNKELNWYTAHCHCGWCIDEVLHLKSNSINAKGSIGIVCESAVVLRSQQNELAL